MEAVLPGALHEHRILNVIFMSWDLLLEDLLRFLLRSGYFSRVSTNVLVLAKNRTPL